MRVQGRVEVLVLIDPDGSVADVKLTIGTPVLGAGVLDAVKRWKFTPFTDQSGARTKAETKLSFEFRQ
jgi:TonB family protein